jgi:hypothetical protein
VPAADGQRPTRGGIALAGGLLISAVLLAAVGGWSGTGLGVVQVGLGAAIVLRPTSPWPPAWSILAVLPGPFAAIVHWTARLPGGCGCARLAHPPPALLSLTGAAVAFDIALLALAVGLTAANRRAEVGKSSQP